jgi:hypothetical protein
MLDLAGHRRVGALHVGGGAQHAVDIGPAAARGGQRLGAGVDRDLGHQAELLVGPRREARPHALRVEHAGLVDHVALLDARGLLDELDARVRSSARLAGGNGR